MSAERAGDVPTCRSTMDKSKFYNGSELRTHPALGIRMFAPGLPSAGIWRLLNGYELRTHPVRGVLWFAFMPYGTGTWTLYNRHEVRTHHVLGMKLFVEIPQRVEA